MSKLGLILGAVIVAIVAAFVLTRAKASEIKAAAATASGIPETGTQESPPVFEAIVTEPLVGRAPEVTVTMPAYIGSTIAPAVMAAPTITEKLTETASKLTLMGASVESIKSVLNMQAQDLSGQVPTGYIKIGDMMVPTTRNNPAVYSGTDAFGVPLTQYVRNPSGELVTWPGLEQGAPIAWSNLQIRGYTAGGA